VDDSYYWPIDLPFPLNFYGTDYAQLAVSSNGTVYFEDDYLGLANAAIPSANSYGVYTFIAHFWDDLVVYPGEVYYWYDGEKFIIEYYQVEGLAGYSGEDGTWEVILFENGNILFQYQDVDMGEVHGYGRSATVGIQGDTVTGLQYSYNTPALSDGLAICFAYPGNPLDCGPVDVPWISEDPVRGTVPADSVVPIDVTFTSWPTMTVGSVYTTTLTIDTDDIVNKRRVVPVTWHITELTPRVYLPVLGHNARSR
jgi:hypothetical protein